jgi:NtrC-family two-component system sensor histidine kinase KinB
MLKALRDKLLLGLAPLLAIVVGLGAWAVAMLDHLGGRIEVILRESYESVLAAEGMKEALERIDSAAQFAINGQDRRAQAQFREYQPVFRRNLEKERRNVTLPGERQLADSLTANHAEYLKESETYYGLPVAARSDYYFNELYKTFLGIKDDADKVLEINHANMKERRLARSIPSRPNCS